MKLRNLLPKSGSYFPIIITYMVVLLCMYKATCESYEACMKVHSHLNDFNR